MKKDLDIKKQEEKEILNKYKENRKTAYVKYLKETSKELMKNVKKEENPVQYYEQQHAAAPSQEIHHDSNYTKKNFSSGIEFLPRNKKQRLVGVIHAGKSVSPSQRQFEQITEEDENEYYSKNYVSENDPGNNYKDIISQYYSDLERVKQSKDTTGVVDRQKMLASLLNSGNNSTRNNNFDYYGNEKTPSFANEAKTKNNDPPVVKKNNAIIEKNKIKTKVSQAMEDEKTGGAYVDSFNFDEEMNRIETGFGGETVSKEAPKKFLVNSDLHSKPVEDPYLKFLEYQKNKQPKPARNTQQKLSGSVDANDRASGFNFRSAQNVAEESEQPNKWTPPARLRSMETKQQEQINKSQEQYQDPPHYQNINVSNNFVASLNQDFVKEDDSTNSMTRNPPPYKTFKLPGPLPTIRKEEVVFAAAYQNKRAEEPEQKKTPPLNIGEKRSLIFKQQASLPEKTNRDGLNSSRATKTKINLHQKVPPPRYSRKGAHVEDEQAVQVKLLLERNLFTFQGKLSKT